MGYAEDAGLQVPWLESPAVYQNAFRVNIKDFVRCFGRKVVLPGWRKATVYIVELKWKATAVKLHIYEEKLQDRNVPVCDQCRCMGKTDRYNTHIANVARCSGLSFGMAFCASLTGLCPQSP
jgi:hypothetical protein